MTFDLFYAAYPLKKAPEDARKAYDKAIRRGYTHQQIMEGVEGYKAEIAFTNRERAYIKHPATFLNKGSFLEEFEGVNAQPLPSQPHMDDDDIKWMARTKNWKPGKWWPVELWGPEPGQPGCKCPAKFLVTAA